MLLPLPRLDPFFMVATVLACVGCGSTPDGPVAAVTQGKADSTPLATPGSKPLREPIEVEWDRLEMPLEPEAKFDPWMVPSRVQELEGKRIRVRGLMYAGGLSQRGNIREFPLIRELGCQFGNGAPAWHTIMVELEGKLRTEYKAGQIIVEGIFRVKPYNGPDGKTWSVYFLQGTKVE